MAMAPSVRVNAVSPGFMETVRRNNLSLLFKSVIDFLPQKWIAGFPQSKIDQARDKTLLKRITKVEVGIP